MRSTVQWVWWVALSVAGLALSFSGMACSTPAAEEGADGGGCPGGKCDGVNNCTPTKQGLDLEPAFGGLTFTRPTALVQRPGDSSRWYLVEQRGVIWTFRATPSGASKPTVFADLRARTNSQSNEAGMFSLAFHPDFDDNGKAFVSYTGASSASPAGLESRISRFESRDDGLTLDVNSEERLITVLQPFSNHNGGQIAFGPDGMLYVGFGDGGSAGDPQNNAQNTNTLLGKILRVDVDGDDVAIPSDNPFASSGGRREIFALGIRNPWRFSFDRATGDLWLGDVGQDAFEEVDIVVKGGNYGWRQREATHCFNPSSSCKKSGMIEPIIEYSHDLGVSITGGFVYRGSDIPSMVGQYVFADFVSGRVFGLVRDGGQVAGRVALESGKNISSFAEGSDGELYTLDFASGGIFKMVAGECLGNEPPPDPLPEHMFLSRDGVGTQEEGEAYYASIGASSSLTLEDWIDDHMTGDTVSAFYRNTADLGFWREMTCTATLARGRGGCWVRNWKNAGDKDDGRADLGTVAMNVSDDGFTRFYAFAPGGARSAKAILDSEGEKFLPRLCTPCHGGQYLGTASRGDMGSIFREFEPSLFELPPGADAADAEQAWFDLNQAVVSANRALRSEGTGGPPGIDHAKQAMDDYIESIYSQTSPPVSRLVTDAAHIPSSWRAGATSTLRTAQANLWTRVVNPTCMGCHRSNTVDFAELSDFVQLGPTPDGPALLRTYLEMDPADGKGNLSFMPQAELLFDNLVGNPQAVEAIEDWLAAMGE